VSEIQSTEWEQRIQKAGERNRRSDHFRSTDLLLRKFSLPDLRGRSPKHTHTHLQIRDTHESHKPSRSACFVDFQSSWEAKCGCTSLLTAHEDFTSESQIYKCEVAFIAVIFILRLVFLIFMAFLPFMFLFDFIASAIGLCLSCGVYAYSNRKDQGQAGFGACG
jgi:hypothetical protein